MYTLIMLKRKGLFFTSVQMWYFEPVQAALFEIWFLFSFVHSCTIIWIHNINTYLQSKNHVYMLETLQFKRNFFFHEMHQ
jgi:hypothetical protein